MADLDAAFSEESLEIRYDNPKRGYHRTAIRMTSGGNRNPANVELGC